MEEKHENIRLPRTLGSTLCEVLSAVLLALALVLSLTRYKGNDLKAAFAVIGPIGLVVAVLLWLSYRPNSCHITLPVRSKSPSQWWLTAWLLRAVAMESAGYALLKTLANGEPLLTLVQMVYPLLLVLTIVLFTLLMRRAA